MNNKTIILGIDPGLSVTGYGILKKEGHQAQLIDYGYLKMSSTKPIPERIGIFHRFFTQKIQLLQITTIALETPFLGKNAQNFLKLGYLRGIVYLLADTYQLNLSEFAPREIKLSVTGFGGADKDQVARVVMRLFPLLNAPDKKDVTDALAVTLCCLWSQQRNNNLLNR